MNFHLNSELQREPLIHIYPDQSQLTSLTEKGSEPHFLLTDPWSISRNWKCLAFVLTLTISGSLWIWLGRSLEWINVSIIQWLTLTVSNCKWHLTVRNSLSEWLIFLKIMASRSIEINVTQLCVLANTIFYTWWRALTAADWMPYRKYQLDDLLDFKVTCIKW